MRKANRKSNGVASGVPWNDQVSQLMSREGMSREKARDRVILEWLKRGDGNALAAMLIDGHVPAPNVRFVLALMLLDNEAAEAALARQHVESDPWWLPYRFVIKGRPAQPRRSREPEKIAGERGAQRAAGPVMPELGYEAAIARLDQAVRATDAGRTVAAGGQAAAQRRSGAKRKR